ncbi:MAG: murein biosynthesis integral membrane protein MurJ [Chloroflexi bacterium 54-19]|nr:MAG: murein biosynthesis integral membrane protein MurJ [Chloroflexi bacterium 54-19]
MATGEEEQINPPRPARTRRGLINSTLLIMGATLLSRILGVVRDIVLTNKYGTTDDYAAYLAAYRIPDTLYLLIIGGALGSSLIPVFSRFLGRGERENAWRLANAVVNYSMVVLAVCSALAWLFAPAIVSTILAPNFPEETKRLTTDLTRLLLLQPFFMGLGGIALALLNGSENFVWPAVAPLIYNLSIIGGTLFLTGPFGIQGVALGAIIGSFLYLLVQVPTLYRLGFYFRPSLDSQAPGAKQVLRALLPRLLGQAAFQANFFIATNLGSGLEQGPARVTAFNLAYQLFMLPHGVFAISLATVAFPAMARFLGENNLAGMKETLIGALRQVFFLALPAALGLGILARPIVMTLYQSGKFDSASTDLVSPTVLCFSFGLVSYGVVEILTRGFFALHDTRTPVMVALVTVGLNFILSVLLIGPLQQGGLALALALSTTAEMVLLYWFLTRQVGSLTEGNTDVLLVAIFKIGIAADLMGLVLLIGVKALQEPLANADKIGVIIITFFLIGLGGAVYAGAAYLLRLEELRSVVRRFVRR